MLISVVHTYTILYSKRVHQKDKKWEDGKLRFYEFNNKFEVISDDGMRVATDFYPSEKKLRKDGPPFEVGTTLVLPSGNLIVEFDDYVGVTNRDVTAAFTKTPVEARPVQPQPQILLEPIEVISNITTVDGSLRSHVRPPIPRKEVVRVRDLGKSALRTPSAVKLESKPEVFHFANMDKWESRILRFAKRIEPGSGRVSKLNSRRN